MEQDAEELVGGLGERGVLSRVLRHARPADAAVIGPGDDAAVLQVRGRLVVTSDTMIEGPDFRLAWHSGFELGWKLAATNLSDVAAMGARPIGLTVALACPHETPVALLEEVSRGLAAACAELAPGCGVVGGDLATAPVLTAAVTALGDLDERSAVLRSGARVGDILAYAGQLGLAGLGLAVLFREATDSGGVAHSRTLEALRHRYPAAIAAQLSPRPPVALGRAAAAAGATAMLDVSDGLSLDAARIAEASGVALSLDPELLVAGFGSQDGEEVTLEAMLGGGEDHGLLATFPRGVPLPAGFHAIGEVREGTETDPPRGVLLVGNEPYAPRGWDPYGALPQGARDA